MMINRFVARSLLRCKTSSRNLFLNSSIQYSFHSKRDEVKAKIAAIDKKLAEEASDKGESTSNFEPAPVTRRHVEMMAKDKLLNRHNVDE